MTYAISDIHGCYDKYIGMLDRIRLSPDDTLYILGDIVDRGADGVKIILDLAARQNVVSLKGNHDHEAFVFLSNLTMRDDDPRADEFADAFRMWLSDGGITTYESYKKLDEKSRKAVLSYLYRLPLFRELNINGQKYFLSHTVPEKEKMSDPAKCSKYDFIMGEPEYEKTYFDDTIIVTGHTPTGFIDRNFTGRIWRGNNHIAIDCGAVFGNPLGCICLETGEEFYVD